MAAPFSPFAASTMFAATPTNIFYQAPSTTAAGLPAPTTVEVAKKKADKIHPCPFVCLDKSGHTRMFACPHNVLQHVREKHTHERPYKCEICADSRRGFNRPFTLNRHMFMVHGIKIGPGKGNGARRPKQGKSVPTTPKSEDQAISAGFDFNGFTPGSTLPARADEANDGMSYVEIQCTICNSLFFDVDFMLMHHHTNHGESPSPFCTCTTCNPIYRGDEADAAKLAQQLKSGGFDVVDEARSAAEQATTPDLGVIARKGSCYDFEALTLSTPAKPANGGFEDLFADDLFSPQTFDNGQDEPQVQESAPTWGGYGTGVQSDIDFGCAEEYDGGIDFGSMDYEDLNFGIDDFGIDGFVGMSDKEMMDAFHDTSDTGKCGMV
ncbi:hypothetical protein LTR08_000203 [Meristemomyces frigidus]|nr:hypothetical protein LTR08_000203 [Meristemomyces frigidus]